MRVLVACEFSGLVRDAFIAHGHDALSCDLLPSERPGPHFQGDVLELLDQSWDLMVAFPPCTHLCASGARWWKEKREDGRQQAAVEFVRKLWAAPILRAAIENPVGLLSRVIGKPTQIIQPWQFGHPDLKATCLWLRGLAPLVPTNVVEPEFKIDGKGRRSSRIHRMSAGPERARERSRTFSGIAEAMAEQWGGVK